MGLGRPRGVGLSLLHCGYCLMDLLFSCMIQGSNGNIRRRGECMNQALFTSCSLGVPIYHSEMKFVSSRRCLYGVRSRF